MKDPQHSSGIWRAGIPAVALIAIALTQVLLARTSGLSPWKGGGFGMFATTDGAAFRYVRVFIDRSDSSEELDIAPSQEDSAARAQLFPSDGMLGRLASAIVERERRYGRPVNAVRVEVWRTEFDSRSLEATDHLLKTFTFHVTTQAD